MSATPTCSRPWKSLASASSNGARPRYGFRVGTNTSDGGLGGPASALTQLVDELVDRAMAATRVGIGRPGDNGVDGVPAPRHWPSPAAAASPRASRGRAPRASTRRLPAWLACRRAARARRRHGWRRRPSRRRSRRSPRSATYGLPSSSNRTFSGRIRPCTTPCRWATEMPAATFSIRRPLPPPVGPARRDALTRDRRRRRAG